MDFLELFLLTINYYYFASSCDCRSSSLLSSRLDDISDGFDFFDDLEHELKWDEDEDWKNKNQERSVVYNTKAHTSL